MGKLKNAVLGVSLATLLGITVKDGLQGKRIEYCIDALGNHDNNGEQQEFALLRDGLDRYTGAVVGTVSIYILHGNFPPEFSHRITELVGDEKVREQDAGIIRLTYSATWARDGFYPSCFRSADYFTVEDGQLRSETDKEKFARWWKTAIN